MKKLIILKKPRFNWKEIIDFTKIKKGGVNLDALLAAL